MGKKAKFNGQLLPSSIWPNCYCKRRCFCFIILILKLNTFVNPQDELIFIRFCTRKKYEKVVIISEDYRTLKLSKILSLNIKSLNLKGMYMKKYFTKKRSEKNIYK